MSINPGSSLHNSLCLCCPNKSLTKNLMKLHCCQVLGETRSAARVTEGNIQGARERPQGVRFFVIDRRQGNHKPACILSSNPGLRHIPHTDAASRADSTTSPSHEPSTLHKGSCSRRLYSDGCSCDTHPYILLSVIIVFPLGHRSILKVCKHRVTRPYNNKHMHARTHAHSLTHMPPLAH